MKNQITLKARGNNVKIAIFDSKLIKSKGIL
jgi:hypothetical protein